MNLQTLEYIIANTPSFYTMLGFTVAIGILIGAMIYNGDLKMMSKGMLTLISYVFLIIYINYDRVFYILSDPLKDTVSHRIQAGAAPMTICIITVFYIIGMLLGVIILNKLKKKK